MSVTFAASVLPLVASVAVAATAATREVAFDPWRGGPDAAPFGDPPRGGPAAGSAVQPDVGLLGRRRRRRLQDPATANATIAATDATDATNATAAAATHATDATSACGACEPALCACVAADGNGVVCAAELDAVCRGAVAKGKGTGETFSIDECVSVPRYYENVYCPFAACLVAGGSYAACSCGFYEDSCDIYGEDPDYKDDADTLQHCAAHAACVADAAGAVKAAVAAPAEAPAAATTKAPPVKATTALPAVATTKEAAATTAAPPVDATTVAPPVDATTEEPASDTPDVLATAAKDPSNEGGVRSWSVAGAAAPVAVAALVWSLSG